MADWLSTFRSDGVALIPRVVPDHELELLAHAFTTVPRARGGSRQGLAHPAVRRVARSDAVRQIVEAILGPSAFSVRAILFNKTPSANWRVPLHQDLAIAIETRLDAPGFGPWSLKHGALHGLAPSSVLETMVSLRIHLDPCGRDNGPLCVVPGSHARGRLTEQAIASHGLESALPCLCERGDVLVTSPLTVHASSKARAPNQRRVLHLEFASGELPYGLQWRDRV